MASYSKESEQAPTFLSPPDRPLRRLVESSQRLFQIAEPWCHAHSDVPEVDAILETARMQAYRYIQAIHKSLEVSQEGVNFSEDAIHLCQAMGAGMDTEQLRQYVCDMIRIAESGGQKAHTTHAAFKSVRNGFMQVTDHIISNVGPDLRCHRRAAQRQADRNTFAVGLAHGFNRVVRTATRAGEIAVSTIIPHLCIVLPAMLPSVEHASNQLENTLRKRAKALAQQILSYDQALEQLWNIGNGLIELQIGTASFAEWWSSIETMLHALEENLMSSPDSCTRVQWVNTIKFKWSNVRADYAFYTQEIWRVQDAYRPVIQHLEDNEKNPDSFILPSVEVQESSYRTRDVVMTLRLLTSSGDAFSQKFISLRELGKGAAGIKSSSKRDRVNRAMEDVQDLRQKAWDKIGECLKEMLPLICNIRGRTPSASSAESLLACEGNWIDILESARRVYTATRQMAGLSVALSNIAEEPFDTLPHLNGIGRSLQSNTRQIGQSLTELLEFSVSPEVVMQVVNDELNPDGGGSFGLWDTEIMNCKRAFSHL